MARRTRKPIARRAESLKDFCRSLPGTTEDIKWGSDHVFSVGKKMYASFDEDSEKDFAFKCDDIDFERLTGIDGIIPAPYAARFGWVMVQRPAVLRKKEWQRLLRKSYDQVFAKLPARIRESIPRA
jgi:predicted DNA-binding protein (MmcQ/YjbR family)